MRSAQRILDATVELIGQDGFDAVNMASVAKAAGVSRQTVYSNFGTREDLVSQAMSQVMVELMTDIRSRLAPDLTGGEYVVELTVAGRQALREHPALTRLMVPTSGSPVFDVDVMERARPIYLGLFADVPGLDVEDSAELLIRIGFSVYLFDSPAIHEDDDLRAFLYRWVVPLLAATSPPTLDT